MWRYAKGIEEQRGILEDFRALTLQFNGDRRVSAGSYSEPNHRYADFNILLLQYPVGKGALHLSP